MRPVGIGFLVIFFLMTTNISAQTTLPAIKWSVAADLMNDGRTSIGYAGMISGVHNDVLIIAGGANFPELLPYQGGKKYYSDKIFVLQKNKNRFFWNSRNKVALPEPVAYAGSATIPQGVIYVGGDNRQGISSKVNLLKWNAEKQTVEIKSLPDLPLAVTGPAVTAIENVVYVACGDEVKNSSARFFCMDLLAAKPCWKSLPDAPKALANAALVFQSEKLFLIGGRTKTASGISELHSTVYSFDPEKNSWTTRASISDGEKTTPFTATAAFAVDENFILLAGGDKGNIFHQIENYLAEIAAALNEPEKEKLIAAKNELVIHHQGFATDILCYDVVENKWFKTGNLPYAAMVTTATAKWNNDLFICSGEIRPGVRSPRILAGRQSKTK